MKRKERRFAALALSLILTAVFLGGCGGKTQGMTGFDAETYVDGLLRENYLGETTPEYMELVGIDEDTVRSAYEAGITNEVNFFISMYQIEYPEEELYEELSELYKKIYSHAKFEVVEAVELEDGSFSVKVDVEPIDIVQLVDTDWDKTITPFYEKYPQTTQNAMSQKEYEEMDHEYAELVLDLYKDKLDEIGNMTAKTVLVEVKANEDGVYSINADHFQALDELIIDYTDNVGVSA